MSLERTTRFINKTSQLGIMYNFIARQSRHVNTKHFIFPLFNHEKQPPHSKVTDIGVYPRPKKRRTGIDPAPTDVFIN
jgi:hypothetical protein